MTDLKSLIFNLKSLISNSFHRSRSCPSVLVSSRHYCRFGVLLDALNSQHIAAPIFDRALDLSRLGEHEIRSGSTTGLRLRRTRLESYRFVGSRDEESRADVKGFGGSGVKSSPGLMN